MDGFVPLTITDNAGMGGGAVGYAKMLAGSVSLPVFTSGGQGYVNPVIRVVGQMEVNGLPNFQTDVYYFQNFIACLGDSDNGDIQLYSGTCG